jgi:hypothetical protein
LRKIFGFEQKNWVFAASLAKKMSKLVGKLQFELLFGRETQKSDASYFST